MIMALEFIIGSKIENLMPKFNLFWLVKHHSNRKWVALYSKKKVFNAKTFLKIISLDE